MRADDGFHLFHDVDTVARRRQNRFLRLDKQQQVGHHMFHASAGLAQFYGVPLNRGLIVRVMFQRVRKLLQRLRRLEELLRNVGDEGITDLGETDDFAHVGNLHHHKASLSLPTITFSQFGRDTVVTGLSGDWPINACLATSAWLASLLSEPSSAHATWSWSG